MHLKLTWCGENDILSTTKNVAIKNVSPKRVVSLLIRVLISSKQHKELGPACQSWREFSYLPTVKITIQIQCFAENYSKQTLKGILLRNETMSCRHTKSSFYTLRRLKHILWKESSLETQEQSVGSGEKAGQKFSSTGERAPGYRLSPDHFQNFKRMPAPDWAQKMLCIIVSNRRTHLQSSFHVFVHDGYCLDHGLCGSCTKEMHAVRKPSVWYKIPIWFQITVCPKTKGVFPKIQASAYNRYSRLHWLQLAYIFMREFLKDTTTADSHENVAWKSELIFFSVSIVIIPTSLLCQMQANSSGAEFLSTIS